MESLGAKIEEISLPHTEYALATYYIIMPAEVSANLARYDGIRYGVSKNAKTAGRLFTKQGARIWKGSKKEDNSWYLYFISRIL
jgi:Asp-tRNA(Asn)/Glu-tRNA(Gln) amidotransferase A subunit family amidase